MDPNIDHTHDDDDDELIQDEDAVYKKRKCHSDFARKDLLHRLFCDATSAKDAGDINACMHSCDWKVTHLPSPHHGTHMHARL